MNNFTPPDEFINLYSLDNFQEKDFDVILDIADNLYDSMLVCISFLDCERFWYKSQEINLPQEFLSFLSFISATNSSSDNQVFSIDLSNNQFFVDLDVGYVVGIPLVLNSGKTVGFLTLWYKHFSELTAKEIKMLSVLAHKTIHLVEQKKRNSNELKFGKNQIQVLLDSTSSFIWSIDRDFNLISANKNYIDTIKKYTGKSVKVGDNFLMEDFFAPELITFFNEKYRKAFLGESFTIDTIVPENQWFSKQWMEMSFYPIFQDKEVISVVVNARNITKRKRDKENIRKSKEQYELLFLSNPQPMWVYEVQTFKFLEVNQAAIQHYGYTKDEFLKLSLYDIVHTDDIAPMIEQSAENSLLQINDFEWRHHKKDGEIIWVQVSSHGIKYQNKKARHVLIHDITEQKRHLALLEEERANTTALINSTDDLVWSIDQDARLVFANEAYINFVKSVTGVSIKIGDSDYVESYPAELNENRRKLNNRALAGESFSIEIYTPDIGKHWGIWSETRFNPIKEGNKVRGAAMFARNITGRKEIELALETNQRILLETSEVARVGGWEIDLITHKVSLSKITKEIHEIPPDYELDFDEIILFHREGESRERILKFAKDVVRTGKDFDFETQIVTAKGNERWVRVKGGVKIVEGESVRLFGMIQDLNDRKKSEILLKETSEIGRVGGWQYDLESRKVTWDFITKEIHEVAFDYEPNFESSIMSYKEGESRDAIVEAIFKAIKDGIPYDLEVQIITAKGKERWVRAKARAEFAGDKPIRIFGMIQDINDQKKHLEEIEMQNKQLREIAWMQSHVVRAPVARIMGIVNLFQDYDDLEISTSELFNNISDSAYEIDDIIRKINGTIQTNHNHIVQ